TAGFIAFLALYYGLITWLTRSLSFKGWGQCLGFASLWVLQELLRSWLFTGFPWLLLGYTQIDSPLQGLAPLIGVYGLSFCVLCLSLIVWALSQKSSKLKQRMLYFAIFVG